MNSPIILASSSPHRKKLLENLGFSFQCHSPNIDERSIESQWKGKLEDLAEHLSVAKAQVLFDKNPKACIIGSDQLLTLDGQSFAKPESKEEVTKRLLKLQGKTHELHTGLCLLFGDKKHSETIVTRLTMRELSESEIQTYVELDHPMGCAGGYKIEEKGALLFSKIETTDHTSIVGLPLLSLVSVLREWGISRL